MEAAIRAIGRDTAAADDALRRAGGRAGRRVVRRAAAPSRNPAASEAGLSPPPKLVRPGLIDRIPA